MRKAVQVAVLTGSAAWSGNLSGCGDAPAPVLSPKLERLEAGVREPLEAAIAAVQAAPDDPALRGELAMLYHANALGEVVEAAYGQAIAMDPAEGRWWYYLAQFRRSQGDLEGALEACRETLVRAPEYNPARRTLGTLLLDLGRPEEALGVFEEALRREPDHVANPVALARAHLQLRDWRAAADLLERVVEEQPGFGYAHALLARAYQGLGDSERARVAASRGRGGSPPAFDPWLQELATRRGGYKGAMQRAERLFAEGDDDGAIRVLVKLREDHPSDVMLLSNLAAAYSRKGQVDSMLAILRQALELDPDHYATHLNMSHGYLAKGDAERALEHAERAIELNADQAAPFAQLAEVRLALGDRDAALEALARAIELQGDLPRYRLRRADLLLEAGRFEQAALGFEEVARANPSSVRAYHGLARSLALAGKLEAAHAALETARGLEPQHRKHAAVARLLEDGGGRDGD